MILKNKNDQIIISKFGNVVGYVAEFDGKEYTDYITISPELDNKESIKDVYRVLIDNAVDKANEIDLTDVPDDQLEIKANEVDRQQLLVNEYKTILEIKLNK